MLTFLPFPMPAPQELASSSEVTGEPGTSAPTGRLSMGSETSAGQKQSASNFLFTPLLQSATHTQPNSPSMATTLELSKAGPMDVTGILLPMKPSDAYTSLSTPSPAILTSAPPMCQASLTLQTARLEVSSARGSRVKRSVLQTASSCINSFQLH